MALTPDGRVAVLDLLVAFLETARLGVTDGDQVSVAPITAPPRREEDGILLVTTFHEDDANFEWREYVVYVGGSELDRDVIDLGRKAPGAVWDLEVIVGAK